MSEPLTAARTDLIHEMFDLFAPDNLVLESEAGDLLDRYAARAVDEALSVERVKVAMRKAWGPYWLTETDDYGQPYEYLDVDAYAAALVAHLRGPR